MASLKSRNKLTPDDEQTLLKLRADTASAFLLHDDAAQCMAARTTEPIGVNAQGEPFKPETLMDIFADMEPEDDDSQIAPALLTARK